MYNIIYIIYIYIYIDIYYIYIFIYAYILYVYKDLRKLPSRKLIHSKKSLIVPTLKTTSTSVAEISLFWII